MKSKFLAVILAIISVVCCAVGLTACGGGKSGNNGTYYLYENGKFDKSKYIILDGSKWSDDDGVNGTYQLNGSTIVFYAEVSGSNEEMYSGTIENGALKISFMGATMTYYIEGSQPSGGSEDETPNETPKTEYTVTFDANGGTFADGKTTLTQNAQEGSTLTAPSSPARTASAFGGWATDKSGKTLWKFATDTVTKNLTLYAVWKEQSAAIISADGATIDEKQMSVFMLVDRNTESVSLANKIVCSSDSVWKLYYDKLGQTEIPTKIAAGKLGELMGGDNIFYIVVTSSSGLQVNVYELTVHRSHSVAVSFYDNKDNLINTDTFYTGYEYTVSYKPDIAGYTFNHWKYKNKSGEVTKFTSYEAVSLYADCTVKSYTAKLDVNGGNELQTAEQTVTYDKSYKFPVPTRTGYSFGGWYSGNTQVTNSNGSSLANWTYANDKTLTAGWQINKYSVTASVNDNKAGSVKVYAVIGGKPSEDGKYNYNSKVTIEATTNDGYTFLGIFDKDDKKLNEDDKLFYVTTLGAAAESYTAKWIACPVEVERNITSAGNVNSIPDKTVVGQSLTLTAETNLGYTWLGWYNGETQLTEDLNYAFTMPDENITYTAKWQLNSELSDFNFTSTSATLSITEVKDKSVTEIVIPDYVTSIGYSAFSGCSSLTSVTIPTFAIRYIPKTNLQTVVITRGATIGEKAFEDCSSLTSITIGNSVTRIGESAFAGCSSLTSITIPDSVTSIGSGAFSGCSGLTSVTIPTFAIRYIPKTNLQTVVITRGATIGEKAFEDCSSLTSITIGNSVTYIGYSAFEDCSSLTSVTIGNSVTYIGSYAFYNCSGLTSITIPDSVTNIGEKAFDGYSSLTSVTIPAFAIRYITKTNLQTVVITRGATIGDYAFSNCSGLTSITIPDSVTEIGSGAFSGCSGLTSVTIPTFAIRYIPKTNLQTVVITSGDTIGDYAFKDCSSLTSITIPDSVTEIGYYAFGYCRGLTSITIPDSVTSIDSWSFSGCSGLTSVYYKGTNNDWNNININDYNNHLMSAKRYYYSETEPIDEGNYWHYDSDGEVSVWELPSLEFTLCDDETYYIVSGIGTYKSSELVIPATYKNLPVKKVKATAFNGNQTITSVTIPNSIIEIGDVAFNCQNLNSVYASSLQDWLKIDFAYMSANPLYYAHNLYINNELVDSLSIPNDVTEIKDNAFTGFYGKTITIGNSVKTIGKCAFANCVKLTNLTIGSSVELINTSAFSDCKSLEEVTIPNSVKTIGYSVFAGCSNLSNIDFGTGVTEILSNAFNECALLQNLYIPSNIKFIGTFAFDSSGLYAVQFAVNSGWYITKDSSMTSGTDIALDDMTQNAIYLKTTYHDYYWKHN